MRNLPSLTFVTGNPKKAEQLAYHLAIPVLHQKLDLAEIQSLDLAEVVKDKAERAYAALGTPVLVEDTSLRFHALGRLPGPLIKWFLSELGNAGLCELLRTDVDRSATAEVQFGLFDGKELHLFEGHQIGKIAQVPKGDQGFGWDPIFIPEGKKLTWGEASPAEQAETSMRRLALKKLEAFLAEEA